MKVSHDRSGFLKETGVMPSGTLALENLSRVTAGEDLMREHGVLRRILLAYDEISSRITSGKSYPKDALLNSADIIKSFIEAYHEEMEEHYLFSRFEKEGKLTDLVKLLRKQHNAGRGVTDLIKKKAGSKSKSLVNYMNQFVRMYRPHAAWEDTVLFPDFHKIVSDKEYDSIGDEFKKKEIEMFGEGGFEKMVGKVEEIEKTLGIYDLSKFTPKV